jgi:hypothetical protein
MAVAEPTSDNMMVVPVRKYYKFDKKALATYWTGKTSTLQLVTCPKD